VVFRFAFHLQRAGRAPLRVSPVHALWYSNRCHAGTPRFTDCGTLCLILLRRVLCLHGWWCMWVLCLRFPPVDRTPWLDVPSSRLRQSDISAIKPRLKMMEVRGEKHAAQVYHDRHEPPGLWLGCGFSCSLTGLAPVCHMILRSTCDVIYVM